MELLLGLIVVVIVASLIYFNRSSNSLDINQDGKVDVEDAKKAVANTVEGVKTTAKKAAVKAKTAGRRGRKPKKAE